MALVVTILLFAQLLTLARDVIVASLVHHIHSPCVVWLGKMKRIFLGATDNGLVITTLDCASSSKVSVKVADTANTDQDNHASFVFSASVYAFVSASASYADLISAHV